jgi:protein ImuA
LYSTDQFSYACGMSSAAPTDPAIEQLLEQSAQLWRGHQHGRAAVRSTGFSTLDEVLPGGGWPLGTLIELAPECCGIGELTLPLPALQALARSEKHIALVRPPYTPYAPALRRAGLPLKQILWVAESKDDDARWAAEQLLREGASAVLLWSDARDDRAMRRLQLAAESGQALAFVYRSPELLQQASSAALRIALRPNGASLRIDVIKVRRGRPSTVTLDLPWSLSSP